MKLKGNRALVTLAALCLFALATESPQAYAYGECRIMKKHSNFYEEIGKVENDRVLKKYSNFYEEVGRTQYGTIEVKHSNFYEEIGKVDNGRIEQKYSNFYEEKGRVYNGRLEKKYSNFYEEFGKMEGSGCTAEAGGAGAVLLGLLPF